MPTRLSAIDASFLFLEDSSTPMHAGGVAIFAEPPEGFDHERLTYRFQGRDFRLTDVHGHVVREILT